MSTTFQLPATYVGPEVELVGNDGNAFAILGACGRALRKAERDGDIPVGTNEAFFAEATAGDYDHLLQTAMKFCEVS